MSESKNKPTAEIIDPGLGELDKVRNILFGRQVKAYEDRFDELEQNLHKMIAGLEQRLDDRLGEMEQKIDDLDGQTDHHFSDVRKDLDNLAAALGTDLAQAKADLRSALDTVDKKLSGDKTDRKALAMMFDEMSIRLRGEDS